MRTEVVGPEIDEDVWDRVVALWREAACVAGAPDGWPLLQRETEDLRSEVAQGRARVDLVMDGPRLLAFSAVALRPDGTAAARPGALHVHRDGPQAVLSRLAA